MAIKVLCRVPRAQERLSRCSNGWAAGTELIFDPTGRTCGDGDPS